MSDQNNFAPYVKMFRDQYRGRFQSVLAVAEQTAEIQQKLNECFAILKSLQETTVLFECEVIKEKGKK